MEGLRQPADRKDRPAAAPLLVAGAVSAVSVAVMPVRAEHAHARHHRAHHQDAGGDGNEHSDTRAGREQHSREISIGAHIAMCFR
jgi:hypothetical protein